MSKNPLGEESSYTSGFENYNPELLFAIPRSESRDKLALNKVLPFSGCDRWNAYEFSWLDNSGLPKVSQLTIDVPCESAFIVESKSLKLYLNSFSFKKFNKKEDVLSLLQADLEKLLKSNIQLHLSDLHILVNKGFENLLELGECLDVMALHGTDISFDEVNANLLRTEEGDVTEILSSNLFRSLCPVTSQPDWASIIISYQGRQINQESLLRYLLSFRKHQGFHEDCVERIYCDLNKACSPNQLSVYAAFTRRGGIDINPFRSNYQKTIPYGRLVRQ